MPPIFGPLACTLFATLMPAVADAGFTPFIIREGGGAAPGIVANDDDVLGATAFIIAPALASEEWRPLVRGFDGSAVGSDGSPGRSPGSR